MPPVIASSKPSIVRMTGLDPLPRDPVHKARINASARPRYVNNPALGAFRAHGPSDLLSTSRGQQHGTSASPRPPSISDSISPASGAHRTQRAFGGFGNEGKLSNTFALQAGQRTTAAYRSLVRKPDRTATVPAARPVRAPSQVGHGGRFGQSFRFPRFVAQQRTLEGKDRVT